MNANTPDGEIIKYNNFLFLDASSSCTGFAIAKVDFLERSANVARAGAIWLNPKDSHQDKYCYLYDIVQQYFGVMEPVDYIVLEQYSVNMDNKNGMLVSPEIHGVIKAAAGSNGVKVELITPQTWRSKIGLKAIKNPVTGKRDYKTPCKEYFDRLAIIPENVTSNITGVARKTPSDVYDALGVCEGWLRKFGITNIKYTNLSCNPLNISEHTT